jgi:hypothetical protein
MQVETIVWRSRPAYLITSPSLHFVVTATGAHLASLTLPSDAPSLNPLWQPSWPAGDPSSAAASGTWGSGEHALEAPLLASICGSNLCADRFGPSYPDEEARPLHGEAGILDWTLCAQAVAGSAAAVSFRVHAPIARLSLTRTFSLAGAGALRIETTLTPLASSSPREHVEVCEHTTLGGAFLDGCVISATVDAQAYEMPGGGGGGDDDAPPASLPTTEALAVPAASDAPQGSVRVAAVSRDGAASWTATNAALRRRLTCAFDAKDFPWLTIWTEHKLRTHAPWLGRERTRGMELSTKPFPQVPPPSRRTTFLGIPTRLEFQQLQPITKAVLLKLEAI